MFACMAGLFMALICPADHLWAEISDPQALELYYTETPDFIIGYATRYGPLELAIREFRWLIMEAADQYEMGYILLGGGYSTEFYGRSAPAYFEQIYPRARHDQQLTPQQIRLLNLASLNESEYLEFLSQFAGIISTKSPNDLGRIFCLFTDRRALGNVIVGGTVARNDWLYMGYSINDDYGHARLGARIYIDHAGTYFWWLADLTDDLYWQSREDDAAIITLREGFCPASRTVEGQ